MKYIRLIAPVVVASLLVVALGGTPAGAVASNSASIWKLTGPIQSNGYAWCQTTLTHSNTIYGQRSPLLTSDPKATWEYNRWYPHGTIKNPSGARVSVTYTAGVNYYCLTKSARKNALNAQSPLLVILNLWSGSTSNMGGGNYGMAGTYSGVVSSPYLYAGEIYCDSSCP